MAGFQVDMSPLVRSSENMGNAYGNIGRSVGNSIQQVGQLVGQRNREEEQAAKQGALNEVAQAAMSGDVAAFQQLMTL